MMGGVNDLLKPRDESEREDDVIQSLVLSIQVALQNAMHRNSVTQKQLADRLGISAARVSQILAKEGSNLTLRTIGRIAHALGEDFELVTKSEALQIQKMKGVREYAAIGRVVHSPRRDPWKDSTDNLNRFPQNMAA
jgi:transcriptional regulator with XRE-family HTH domain